MSSDISPPDGTLCPHFDRVDETTLNELFSKVAKVRSENKELFDFTHRQISVFDIQSDETYTEADVYRDLDRSRIGNFGLVIEGNVGTGKSELCAYLSHRLREDGRPVLHIDKDADLLSIMAEEIPDFYREETGEELSSARNIERLQENVRNNRNTVATLVVAKAKLKIAEKANTNVDLTASQTEQLEAFVEEKLVAIAKRGDFATKVTFVEPEEVQQFDYLNVFDSRSRDEAASVWNDTIWESVREEYETPSLDQLLKNVGQAFGETRPVIVFEDFSISSLDADKLVKYMEEDNPEHNWDFIVAGTQDSTAALKTQTGLERHSFYRTNRPDSNSVLFLDRESAVDFIRPYLAYIKFADRSVSYQRNDANEIESLVPPEPGSICDRCGLCDDVFRDLFPFTETFLQRVYDGLDEEDQRPRQYVQKIFDVVQDYYDGYVLSPASSDELGDVDNPVILASEVYNNDDFRRLAKWYGEPNEHENIVVDKRFPQAFGLADIDFETLGVGVEEATLIVPTPGGEVPSDNPLDNPPDDLPDDPPEPERKSKEERKIEELQGELDNWRSDPTDESVSGADLYLRTGIRDALDRLTDGFSLQEDGALEYQVSSGTDPFVYEEYDLPNDIQIEIDPADFTSGDLLELLRFGVYREMDPRSADYDAVLNQMGTQLTAYAKEWRERVRSSTIDDSSNFYYVSSGSRDFEDFIIGAYGVILMLDEPWTEVTADRVSEAYHDSETPQIDDVLKGGLRDRLSHEDYENVAEFVDYADSMEGLIDDYFGVSQNALDRPRIRKILSGSDPMTTLKNLKKSAWQDLPAAVRFDTQTHLREVGLASYDAANSLGALNSGDDTEAAYDFIEHHLRGVDMENVSDYVSSLQNYDDVETDIQELLSEFSRYSQDDVDAVLEGCTLYNKLDTQRSAQVHAMLAGLRIYEHELTGILTNIEFDGVMSEGAADFMTISEYYANQ